jgi:hypothetical protein
MKLLIMQFSQITVSPCLSLNVREQVSHLYRTIDKIIVLYILIFACLNRRREDKVFWAEW